jgi:nucleoside-diphosphate-sugar epimerase
MILLTGSSGFLGNFIYNSLFEFDKIVTLGRTNCIVNCDISTSIPSIPEVNLVVHAAGKAHFIPRNEKERQAFFEVNVVGTANLLKGLELLASLPQAFVFISSVSVYGLTKGVNVSENTPLLAKDPYGLSKIEAEKLVSTWCAKNKIRLTILRLPLLAGANPPGNLGAMIKGIQKGYYFNIGGGKSKKSIVLASDVANSILKVSKIGGVYNLTDGYHPSFKELSICISKQLQKKTPLSLPFWFVNILASIGDINGDKSPITRYKLKKIVSDLTFDDNRARIAFGWNPTSVLTGFRLQDY